MSNKLFRKDALKKLSSPEQLDSVITVVDPKGIYALAGFILLVLALFIWGIWGSIGTKVYGTSVLLKSGGVFSIKSIINGKITDISVVSGDVIKAGEVIARLSQTKLLRELFEARHFDKLEQIKEREQLKLNKRKQVDLKERLELLETRLKAQQDLFKKGMITKDSVFQTEDQILNARYQIEQLSIESAAIKYKAEARQRQLQALIEKFKEDSEIVSPYSGRILEVSSDFGTVVNPGDDIVTLELTGKNIKSLEAVVFVPLADGKKIKNGMQVTLSPTTVQKEEYGTLLARVHTVSPFPATRKEMMRLLQNETLVDQIIQSGPQIAVYAHLVPDPKTISGYKWTSAAGPPIRIDSGTLATASVTVDKQRPMTLILPLLKKMVNYE